LGSVLVMKSWRRLLVSIALGGVPAILLALQLWPQTPSRVEWLIWCVALGLIGWIGTWVVYGLVDWFRSKNLQR
jgi:hypothetical protein